MYPERNMPGIRKTFLLMAVVGLARWLFEGDPTIGTWKLNAGKTRETASGGAISESSTVKIEAQGNGIKFRWDAVKPDGRAIHGEFAAKYDGKDYPVTGDPDSDTVALRKIDANTVEYLFKREGQVVSSECAVVSIDGKTITLTVKGIDSKGKPYEAVVLYDRQ